MNDFYGRLQNDGYEMALARFEQAVSAFCGGDVRKGDELLATLDRDAIERDMAMLRELGRTAQPAVNPTTAFRTSKTVSRATQQAVQLRDRYHCRFTRRRLIDTNVFHEVSRISGVFHFDSHHSVRDTERGPAGHPMVRTHAAAYEHVEPHSCGGTSNLSNIVHTSVQLNESKGARTLPMVEVPNDSWNGMREYLPELRRLRSAIDKPSPAQTSDIPFRIKAAPDLSIAQSSVITRTKIREAAAGLPVRLFTLGNEVDGETAFTRLRREERNWYFATPRPNGSWMIHRLHCSSLAFNGDQKLTAKPKLCSAREAEIREWANRLGVAVETCSRCRKAK